MNKIFRYSALALLLISFNPISYADREWSESVLTIDEPVPNGISINFPDEDTLEPKLSEFQVLSSFMMSSNSGERWAIITLKNLSAHQRLLDNRHIVAVFANGVKSHPPHLEHKFSGKEEITLTIGFGISQFPILKVLTRN